MSNQRSCILFIALVIILLYLYYESIQKKALHETREKLLIESSSSNRMQNDEPKVLFGRHLLSYSTENAAEVPSETEISSLSASSFKFRTVNTFPYADHRNKLKRIKRNVRNRKGIYKWKFNVSVSKLDDEFTKPTDNLKNSVEENQIEEESLNVEIYIDGKTKQFKNLEHSWHAVKDSLRNFYKEPKDLGSKDIFNSQDFSSQISKVNIEDSATKESEKLTSSKDSFSTIQNSSEKQIREETKKINLSSKGREAKFLFLDFGGGGNKENPPILPEIGDNMVSKDTPTESMHDLSFFNSTEQFDMKIVPSGVFSSTLLPEHQNLDLPMPEPNLSFTTSSETKLDSKIKVSKPNTPNPISSNEILNCDDCVVQETKPSVELQTVIDVTEADATNSVVQTIIPINVVDISPGSIQMFCSNFVQSIQKSPRFDDDIGSGRLDTDNNMEIFQATNIGSGNLDVDEVESFRVTTPPVTTLKTTQQQLGLLQRLWNRIPNFRSRNQRNLVNDDLEISGFPTNFSVQDCKDLFTNQIKSEFNTLQTTLEETILTETKSIPLFSPDNLISETENSLKSSLDFIKKSDVVEVDEITTMLTTDLIVQFQNKPLATESTSNILQNVPSFFDQIMTTDKSNMVSIVPVKQTNSIGNLDQITIAEELSLKIEDSGEQPKVSRSTVIGLITTSTASPLNEPLIDLNTKSNISLSVRPNTISSDNPEDLTIIPSERVIQEDKRFFSDLNNDDILELGSSDERIISDKVTTMDEIGLKEVTFDQNRLISERRFIPNFFSEGSGARELPESFTPTDINLNKNEFSLSETNFQSLSETNFQSLSETNFQSLSDSLFLESENALKKTTVDFMQTSTADDGRRFIPNFFSEGSGARELLESSIPTDINPTDEFNLSETNVESVSDSIFLQEENALKKTINFMQTPMANEGRRFIPNFFSEGSGARELSELYATTVSDRIFVEELSKKEISRNDILINNHNYFSLEPFDIGSGERKVDGIEITVGTKDSNINFRSDYVSLPEFRASSDSDDLINEKITTDIFPKIKTDPPVHHDIFMNDIGNGEFVDQNKDNSEQNFIFRSSGDGRDISEILFNDTVFTPEQLCTNCTDNLNFPDNCDNCDYFDEIEIHDSNVTNETVFKSYSTNISHSTICNDCEGFNNDKFSSSEYSVTTQKSCINCSNVSIEKSKSQADIILLTAEESPTESKHPSNETMVAQSAISYSQDSKEANSTLSNSNKNDPIFVDLLIRNESDTHDENKIYFDPEPEITVQPSKPTKPSRRARLNDILPPDILDFSSKPETSNDVPSKSSIIDSTFIDLSGVNDTINIDQMHLKPEPEISSKPLTRRRGARFDVSPTHVPGFTSKQETTESEVQTSIPPKQLVNLFQSRRGARGHDLFDLEDFNSEATVSISEEETESGTLSTFEEAANTLTETKTDLSLNPTLIFENQNDATKSTDLSKGLRVFSTEIPRHTNESFTSLFSEHSSETGSIPSASSTEVQSLEVNLNPELTLPSPKFCHSASECNVSLNERCMPNDDILICNCGKAFSRNLKTKKCEATITLQTSITLPGKKFHEDLRNKNTYLYQQKKSDYIKIMWFLLKYNPNLFHTVAEVDITSFEEGSLIVNYTLKLLGNGNETASELAQLLQEDLNKIINDQEVLKNASLEFKNASVSIFVLNPCLSSEMNYCHKNALCIPTEEKGFKCQCKADYLDNSRDKRYPGENCTGICASNYCGTNGECYVKDNGEKKCRCEGWYLGEKCEMNGLVVIAVFAFASFLVIAVVVLVVFYCKKNRNRQFYNRNMTNFQPGQDHPTTGDAIVLDEVTRHCRMSKFLAVSTPLYEAPNPTIQVTSPSFTGSSIDYDSTFDRTPYDSESSRNTSGVAPKV